MDTKWEETRSKKFRLTWLYSTPVEKNQTIPSIHKKVLQAIWASPEPPPPSGQCPDLSSFLDVCSLTAK